LSIIQTKDTILPLIKVNTEDNMFYRIIPILMLVLCFVQDVFSEPLTATAFVIGSGIVAGASLLGSLVSFHGQGKGIEQQIEAQEKANIENLKLTREQMAEGTRQFDASRALNKMKFKLYKEESEMATEERAEQKQFNRAMQFQHNFNLLAANSDQRSSNLIQAWNAPKA